jgi:hypothetical protein
MAAKEKIKDKDKDLKKGKTGAGLTGDEEEEIIEKKPSAPVELTLMIIIFVVMIVGIYLAWGQLSDFYWDTALYNDSGDAIKVLSAWRTTNVQKIPPENLVVPDVRGQQDKPAGAGGP